MPDRGLFYSAGGPTKRAFRLLTERTLADGAAARQLGRGRFRARGRGAHEESAEAAAHVLAQGGRHGTGRRSGIPRRGCM